MRSVIDSVSSGVPAMPAEIRRLGRTLKQPAPADVLVFFDLALHEQRSDRGDQRPREHLRGSAPGFRNLANYTARACSRPEVSDPRYTLDSESRENWDRGLFAFS